MDGRRLIRVIVVILVMLAARWYSSSRHETGAAGGRGAIDSTRDLEDPVATAFANHFNDTTITFWGIVTRTLPDDRDGSRHQRFTLRTPGGASVLIAHNLDLAPRLAPLAVGDTVQFTGEYAWNEQGGVVHWTHHDPQGRHRAGHLTAHGRTVE